MEITVIRMLIKKYWKPIVLALWTTGAMWMGSHYRVLEYQANRATELESLQKQKEENDKKALELSKQLEIGKQKYEKAVRKIITPTGCTFDDDGVQRIQERLNESRKARQS